MASSVAQCVVCCHESSTWSIGICDHPICLTCSARLRVLCEQTACPVCRVDLKQVVVATEVKPFAVLSQGEQRVGDRKYGFAFQTAALRDAYNDVRSHRCTKCRDLVPFRTFDELRDHVRRTHGLYYCDICVDNLKLFPSEQKAYTRHDLITHRRDGDPEDSSHKGHPLCQFCDDRFLDNDALLHHLRTVHQWCHVCEGLGRGQNYYADFQGLRQHFKAEHFLCEEGGCRHAKATSVFATKIDLQAHRAAEHSSGLSKAEAKQLRQIEVGFTYNSRRGGGGGEREDGSGLRGPPRSRAEEREREETELSAAIHASRHTANEEPMSSKRLSPTLREGNEGAKVKDQGTTSKTSGRKHASGNERRRKDPPQKDPPHVVAADKKMSHSSGGKPEEGSTPQRSHEGVPSARVATGEVGGDEDDTKSTSNTSKMRRPPGFEHVACAQEGMPSLQEVVLGAHTVPRPMQDSDRTTQAAATAIPDNWKTSHQSVTPVQGEWPSLATSGPSTEAKSRNTSAPPGFVQLSAKSTLTSVISRVQASFENRDDYEKFKTLSRLYASGQMEAQEYHTKSLGLLGRSAWNTLGPELAGTLPNESKQKELLMIFQRTGAAGSGASHKPKPRAPPGMSQVQRGGVWTSGMGRNLRDKEEFPTLRAAADLPDYPQPAPGWNSRVLGTAT